jgi:chorismate synthase
MLAIILMDHVLRHRAQNMDVQCDTPVLPPSAPPTSNE